MNDKKLEESSVGILKPDNLLIHENDFSHFGGNQDWFSERWQQQAGCGPTNAANLIWYHSQKSPDYQRLCPYQAARKEEFIMLMEDVWNYVTPGNMGVNSTEIFRDGVLTYGKDHGIILQAKTLEVAGLTSMKRNYEKIREFVTEALSKDLAVAFLNLSNGTLQNLDSWHWVTVVAMNGEEALIYDQGKAFWINMRKWTNTSLMGGGFVYIDSQ